MGNCCSGKDHWIAKETFHPSEDLLIEDTPLLQITKDDKLKLIDDNKFIDRDMYLMRNLNTKHTGNCLLSKVTSSLSQVLAGNSNFQTQEWIFVTTASSGRAGHKWGVFIIKNA